MKLCLTATEFGRIAPSMRALQQVGSKSDRVPVLEQKLFTALAGIVGQETVDEMRAAGQRGVTTHCWVTPDAKKGPRLIIEAGDTQ